VSLTGHTPEEIRQVLTAGLLSQSYSVTIDANRYFTVTLHESEDDKSSAGARESVDGGFTVELMTTNTTGLVLPSLPIETTQGHQPEMRYSFDVRAWFDFTGFNGDVNRAIQTKLTGWLIGLILKAVVPPSGANLKFSGLSAPRVGRDPDKPGMYKYTIQVGVTALWKDQT
jgi:hypothetical protein